MEIRSLYDQFIALKSGQINFFRHQGEKISVEVINPCHWILTDEQGNTAKAIGYMAGMTDLQSIAANLQKYRKNLYFRDDNLVPTREEVTNALTAADIPHSYNEFAVYVHQDQYKYEVFKNWNFVQHWTNNHLIKIPVAPSR